MAETTGAGGASATLAWCDVEPILRAKCQRCHQEPPKNGAPFPLLSYADTQVNDRSPRTVLMQHALEGDLMPPTYLALDPPVQSLTCDEKLTLLGWLDAGAEGPDPDDEDCAGVKTTLLSCE